MISRPNGDGRVTYGLRAPSPRIHTVPILRVRGDSWRDLVIVSPRTYGVEIYFDGSRTQPVNDGQRADPDVYQSLVGKRWQGWMCVRPYHSAALYLVAITPVTVACVPQLDDPDFDLRGWTVGLKREGRDERGKLKARWNQVRADLQHLPHPPDVVEVLERMWRAPLKRKSLASSFGRAVACDDARRTVRDVADSLTIPH